MSINDLMKSIDLALESASCDIDAVEEASPAETAPELIYGSNGQIKSIQYNYGQILKYDGELSGRFAYDSFKNKVMVRGPLIDGNLEELVPISDNVVTKVLNYIGPAYRIEDEKKTMRAIREVAEDYSFDSLLGTFDALVWDGVPRIETMLTDLLGADDTVYTREVAKVMMRGAVCRAYVPGIQFDLMIVLVGRQGCRKTTFCRALALDPEWFEDNLGDLNKPDAARKIQGILIVEMAELAALKYTKSAETTRAFVTRTYDSYRLLYTEDTPHFPRRCIFIGTTNDYEFLRDPTGNRRYLPIECGLTCVEFDWTDEKKVKHYFEQIWAEAITWYKSDPKGIVKQLKLPDWIEDDAETQRSRFKEDNPWIAPIRDYLDRYEQDEICAKRLMVEVLQRNEHDPKSSQVINEIHSLMRSGFDDWEQIRDVPKRLGEYGLQRIYYRKKRDR